MSWGPPGSVCEKEESTSEKIFNFVAKTVLYKVVGNVASVFESSELACGTMDCLERERAGGDKTAEQTASAMPMPQLPGRLRYGGPTHVYQGVKKNQPVYAGITNDLARRGNEHASRFILEPVTKSTVPRGAARAIEEALIVMNPGFENIRHSISPKHSWYQAALDWGKHWLKANGY